MRAPTRLDETAVQTIADRVLGARWRDIGCDHVDVSSEDDVYGEPALSLTAWLTAGSSVIPVDLYSRTLLDLREAIRAEGEERYAYMRLRSPDDEHEAEDDASDPQ